MNAYVNPANAITASRYLTLPPFLYFLDNGSYQLSVVSVILCGFLDLFDGAAARYFKCSSGFGEFFDAATDGICYGFIFLMIGVYGRLPWLVVGGFLGIGIVNSIFRLIYSKRAGRTTNYQSFAMERLVGLSAFVACLAIYDFEGAYMGYVCVSLMLVVLIHDTKRMLIDPVPA